MPPSKQCGIGFTSNRTVSECLHSYSFWRKPWKSSSVNRPTVNRMVASFIALCLSCGVRAPSRFESRAANWKVNFLWRASRSAESNEKLQLPPDCIADRSGRASLHPSLPSFEPAVKVVVENEADIFSEFQMRAGIERPSACLFQNPSAGNAQTFSKGRGV
jgi:hypothetical protein